MWLYYWMAANGINPMKTSSPCRRQMVANMRVGNMDGYCVGEPWNTAPSSTASGHRHHHPGHLEETTLKSAAGHHRQSSSRRTRTPPRRDCSDP
jgi:hypothetical protein